MSKTRVLILDDEKEWVSKHKFWLEDAGLECIYVYDGREAVDIAINDHSIKVALIDEILLEKDEDGMTVTQPLQGGDVRNEIRKQREDIYFIIISSKPEKEFEKWKQDPLRAFRETNTIEKNLRQEERVINFYHKYSFEDPQKIDEEYHFLLKDIREILQIKPYQNTIINLEFPSLYIGLGVNAEYLRKDGHKKTTRFKGIRKFFNDYYEENRFHENDKGKDIDRKEMSIDKEVRQLYHQLKQLQQEAVLEKKLYWIEAKGNWSKAKELKVTGAKGLRPAIKPGTRAFEILEFLGWQVECRTQPIITAEHFLYDICGMKRPATGQGRKAVAAFKKEQGQTGVEIETLTSDDRKRLTVEISRLSTLLVEANIGFQSNKQIFQCDEGSTSYTALFKTGVVFYAVK